MAPDTTYRTGYLGRSNRIHVLTLTSGDPFYRSLCAKRWRGSITTLSNEIAAADKTAEFSFVDCARCYAAFSKVAL
jgi:hypothetical protein